MEVVQGLKQQRRVDVKARATGEMMQESKWWVLGAREGRRGTRQGWERGDTKSNYTTARGDEQIGEKRMIEQYRITQCQDPCHQSHATPPS